MVRFEKLKNKIYFVGCTFFPGLSVNYTCPVGATIIWPITSKLVSSACCENFCRFTFLELIINIFRRTIFFLLASMKPFMSIPFFFLSFFLSFPNLLSYLWVFLFNSLIFSFFSTFFLSFFALSINDWFLLHLVFVHLFYRWVLVCFTHYLTRIEYSEASRWLINFCNAIFLKCLSFNLSTFIVSGILCLCL